ncbi:MAG: RluA family pseudouridine synthase [Planctomycetes bacterium]|nr:RluA family pseudouridine synthase [Planctomycetota bacterium]
MDEDVEILSFRVPRELDGARLDAALVARCAGRSRSRLAAAIKAGAASVDGVVVTKPGTPVAAGAEVCLGLPRAPAPPAPEEARRALDVLYEDEHLVVVNKPAGLLTHRTERGGERSLAELARASYGELPSVQGEDRPGVVHRLDRETSGVIVLGRTQAALDELLRQFREREVEKTYQVLVHGEPRFDSDWITAPLGRDPRSADRVAVLDLEEGGRAAETYYEVRERFAGYSHLAAQPKTGRTHQIRVHLTSIGCPVVGDRVYQARRSHAAPAPAGAPVARRQLLHAERLALRHPVSGAELVFEAPTPRDLAEWLAALRAARDA